MDKDAIKTLIRAAGFGADAQTDSALDQAINGALLELSGEREWSWLLQTDTAGALTIGDETVTLPTDFAYPKAVRLALGTTAYAPLQRVDSSRIRERLFADSPAALAVPTQWAYSNELVVVWPRPVAAYDVSLDYVFAPSLDDFGDSDVPHWFDRRFDIVLAWGAMRWLALRQRDTNFYALANGEWQRARAQMEQADRGDGQRSVAEWPGWGAVQ